MCVCVLYASVHVNACVLMCACGSYGTGGGRPWTLYTSLHAGMERTSHTEPSPGLFVN